jgi:hypothetical protein
MALTTAARIAAALVALIAWTGLVIQLGASRELTGAAGSALWEMLRYFTIIANLLVAILFTAVALGSRRAASPFLLGGATLAILLVGIVYMLLLRGLLELSAGALVADILLHKVTPVVVPLWWLGFAPKGGLGARDPWLWALLPLAYFAYALARGAQDNRYPYPFMNVTQLGWGQTLLNALLMAAGFLIAGYGLLWLDRLFDGRVRQR